MKNKTILCLNPVSIEKYHYHKWFCGYNVVMVCNKKIYSDFKPIFSNLFCLTEYDNKDHLYNYVMQQLTPKFKFDYIIALSENDLIIAGKLRDELNLPGQTEQEATIFRNKFLMKKTLQKVQPDYLSYFALCHNFAELTEASKQLTSPFIIKPLASYGSIGVELIEDLSKIKTCEYPLLVEEYIQGETYHIDGLFSENKIQYISISKYVNGCLAFNQKNFLGSVPLEKEEADYDKIKQVASDIICAFPFPDISTFHLELFKREQDGKILFCELASRTGGGNINQCVQLNLGINITELWVKGSIDSIQYPKPNISTEKYGFMLYPAKEGVLTNYPFDKLPDYVVDYKCFYNVGETISKAKHSVDALASFVIKGKNSSEIIKYMHNLNEWCNQNIKLTNII